MNPRRVLIEISTCLREGHFIAERTILPSLQNWSTIYEFGYAMLLESTNSATMNKSAFLLEKYSKVPSPIEWRWKTGDIIYQRRCTWPDGQHADPTYWVQGVIVRINPKAKREQVLIHWKSLNTTTFHTLTEAPWKEGAVACLPLGHHEV